MREAFFYEKLKDSRVKCHLCPHGCIIGGGKRGICGVRENKNGVLYSLNYGKLIAENLDPIEKKPLFHFLPGSLSYSIATVGCNLRCLHCQNAEISQFRAEIIPGKERTPQEALAIALNYGAESISYTYTEPTIFFEFAYELAKIAHAKGLKNNFVTNGYATREAWEKIAPYLDGANIDLKSFRDDFYRKICGAQLTPVLESITLLRSLGIWIEVTTLIIPTLNDSEKELRDIARFIASLDNSIPWHVTAFYPHHKLTQLPPTSAKKLFRAREIGLEEGLNYVYVGNILGGEGENTYCNGCGSLLIRRRGFSVTKLALSQGKCRKCGKALEGVFE